MTLSKLPEDFDILKNNTKFLHEPLLTIAKEKPFLGQNWQMPFFTQTFQYFAQFSKLIREMSLF